MCLISEDFLLSRCIYFFGFECLLFLSSSLVNLCGVVVSVMVRFVTFPFSVSALCVGLVLWCVFRMVVILLLFLDVELL